MGCSSSFPFSKKLDERAANRSVPGYDPKGINTDADVNSNNGSFDVEIPIINEVEKIVSESSVIVPESTVEISDNIENNNTIVDIEQAAIEENYNNVAKDIHNIFSDVHEINFNEEKIRQKMEKKLSSMSSISDIYVHQNVSLISRDLSSAIDNLDGIIVPSSLEEPLEIPLGNSFLGASSPTPNESHVQIKATLPVSSTVNCHLNKSERESMTMKFTEKPSDFERAVNSGSFQLREPDCIGKEAHIDFPPPVTIDTPIVATEDKRPHGGECVTVQDDILGSETVPKIFDTVSISVAINTLLLGSESLDTLANQEVETGMWTEIDSFTAAEKAKDDNFLVPTAPSVILKSPKFQKSEIKKDTISSDFASLDSYKNSAKIGRTDLSFANEPEILIRKSEHNACFGSSLDSYKQSELNSIRRNSNHSQLSTATPRGRSGSSGVRSGSGTPTIVEELEENESEHGSSEIIPTVKEKIPKLPSLGFSNLAVLPDSPTKTSVKDRIGQIQKQTCAKTLITPRSPSPALSITLSPITPRMDSVENMIEKISSTSSSSSIEAMNDKPETIWPSRHIDIPPENLSLESTPITFPMNTDLASPLQENSSKSNGKLTLEIPKIVEEIIENEIEHVSSDKALKVITESFPNKSLDGFGTMVSDSPTQTSVKYIVDKFQSPTNIESMSSSTRFSSSQEIPSTTTSPVQSEIPKSVKDMIGKWGIQKDIPDKIKEAVDVNIKSRRVSDRWKPLQKDVIDKVIQPKRPESSRMKNVTSTWGAVVTEASYKKKESEIIIGKLNSKA